jgi:hypothetical protein
VELSLGGSQGAAPGSAQKTTIDKLGAVLGPRTCQLLAQLLSDGVSVGGTLLSGRPDVSGLDLGRSLRHRHLLLGISLLGQRAVMEANVLRHTTVTYITLAKPWFVA